MTDIETTELPTMTTQPTPVLSLRDVVVYPHMVIPLFVGRERSILALSAAPRSTIRPKTTCSRSAPWPRFCNC